MAKTSSIDRKDAKTKKAIVKSIIKGVPVRKIAEQNDTSPSNVFRFKKKVQGYIARKANQEQEYVAMTFNELVGMAEKHLKNLDEIGDIIKQKIEDGDDEAEKYLKLYLEVVNVLRPLLLDICKMTGNIKETAEANNSPTLILAKIQQVIQQTGGTDTGTIISALDSIR